MDDCRILRLTKFSKYGVIYPIFDIFIEHFYFGAVITYCVPYRQLKGLFQSLTFLTLEPKIPDI